MFDVADEIKNRGDEIYDQFMELHYSKQHDERVYRAASVVIAAQENQYPYTMRDAAKDARVDRDDVASVKSTISKKTGIKTLPTPAEKFLPRIVENLPIPATMLKDAQEILNRSDKVNRAPLSMAAGAVYVACNDTQYWQTRRKIAKASGASEEAVKRASEEMAKVVAAAPA